MLVEFRWTIIWVLVLLAVIMLSFAPFDRFTVEIVSTMTCSESSGTLNSIIIGMHVVLL